MSTPIYLILTCTHIMKRKPSQDLFDPSVVKQLQVVNTDNEDKEPVEELSALALLFETQPKMASLIILEVLKRAPLATIYRFYKLVGKNKAISTFFETYHQDRGGVWKELFMHHFYRTTPGAQQPAKRIEKLLAMYFADTHQINWRWVFLASHATVRLTGLNKPRGPVPDDYKTLEFKLGDLLKDPKRGDVIFLRPGHNFSTKSKEDDMPKQSFESLARVLTNHVVVQRPVLYQGIDPDNDDIYQNFRLIQNIRSKRSEFWVPLLYHLFYFGASIKLGVLWMGDAYTSPDYTLKYSTEGTKTHSLSSNNKIACVSIHNDVVLDLNSTDQKPMRFGMSNRHSILNYEVAWMNDLLVYTVPRLRTYGDFVCGRNDPKWNIDPNNDFKRDYRQVKSSPDQTLLMATDISYTHHNYMNSQVTIMKRQGEFALEVVKRIEFKSRAIRNFFWLDNIRILLHIDAIGRKLPYMLVYNIETGAAEIQHDMDKNDIIGCLIGNQFYVKVYKEKNEKFDYHTAIDVSVCNIKNNEVVKKIWGITLRIDWNHDSFITAMGASRDGARFGFVFVVKNVPHVIIYDMSVPGGMVVWQKTLKGRRKDFFQYMEKSTYELYFSDDYRIMTVQAHDRVLVFRQGYIPDMYMRAPIDVVDEAGKDAHVVEAFQKNVWHY